MPEGSKISELTQVSIASGDDIVLRRATANYRADIGAALAAKQGLHANLTALAGLTSAADKLPYFTGSGAMAIATLTSAARSLLDDTTAAAMATTLGLGTGNNVKFTGASIGAGYAGTAPPTNGMIVEGNLGVGTTAPGVIGGNTIPGKVLQVSGDASTRADLVLAGNAARIDLEDTQGTTGSRVSTLNQDGDMLRIAPSGNTGGMHATNGLTLINASGNVGINTTTPTAALTVNGNVHAGSGVTGADCNFIGNSAGTNASGSSIVGIGTYSLDAGVSGQSIVAAGVSSLSSLTTGGNNTAAGHASGANIVGSSWSVFLGSNAGRYAGDGSTSLTAAEKSIFIGHTTQPAGNSQTNQIVIGHLAIGNGSNTTTIGNSTTVATHLAAGSLVINEMTAPSGVANKVTLYAEDNGSGKTRLMAIFGSGAAQQIAIEP